MTIKIFDTNLRDFNKPFHYKNESDKMTICNIKIPFFQRQYRWDENNWEKSLDMLEDINNGEYFMGSLILNNSNKGHGFELIDGQQRITTLAIFIKALADKFRKYEGIKDLIIFNINHNRIDKKAFDEVMEEGYEGEIYCKKKKYESQIKKCYDYFKTKFEEEGEGEDKENFLKNQESFFNNLDKIKFGIILLPSNHQQDIFDRLNSNAVPLTQAELIKNYLFQDNIKAYEEIWYENFEKEKDDLAYWDLSLKQGRRNIDMFLFSLFYAKSEQHRSKTINNKELKDEFEKGGREKWIDLIGKKACEYKNCIKPEIQGEAVETALDRLNLIIFTAGYHSVIPYLFYIFTSQKQNEEKEEIYKYLEKYLISRLITEEPTNGYNNFFVSLINNEKSIIDEIKKTDNKSLKMPTIDEIEKQFEEGNWGNNKAKLVLYLIEKSLWSGKSTNMKIDLLTFKEYQLEHIIPQISKNWKEFEETVKGEERSKFIYNIGNMLFLKEKLNKENSNKDRVGKAKEMEGKMTGVLTFEGYDVKEWDEKKVEERSKKLFGKAREIWDF